MPAGDFILSDVGELILDEVEGRPIVSDGTDCECCETRCCKTPIYFNNTTGNGYTAGNVFCCVSSQTRIQTARWDFLHEVYPNNDCTGSPTTMAHYIFESVGTPLAFDTCEDGGFALQAGIPGRGSDDGGVTWYDTTATWGLAAMFVNGAWGIYWTLSWPNNNPEAPPSAVFDAFVPQEWVVGGVTHRADCCGVDYDAVVTCVPHPANGTSQKFTQTLRILWESNGCCGKGEHDVTCTPTAGVNCDGDCEEGI